MSTQDSVRSATKWAISLLRDPCGAAVCGATHNATLERVLGSFDGLWELGWVISVEHEDLT